MTAASGLGHLLPREARFASVEVSDEDLERLDPLRPGEGTDSSGRWAPKRWREFRAGRQVARRVLSELGLPEQPLVRGADGLPSYPVGVAASITHTGGRRTFAAAAALRGARGLGIDAEQTRPLGSDLCARILTEEEAKVLSARGPLEELGLLAFSAKEAFYKCVYPTTRSFLEFAEVHFELLADFDGRAERSGAFRASSPRCASRGGPLSLEGRFVWTRERVLTAVVWH